MEWLALLMRLCMLKTIGIYGVLFMLALIGAGNAVLLGIEWFTIGYGLHPLIAFPVAILCCLACTFSALVVVEEGKELAGQ